MSINTYEAMRSLEAEKREHQAEIVSAYTSSGSRTREAATRALARSTRIEAANMNAYLNAARRHAEVMGRPTDVYDSFIEIIRGYKGESASMDVWKRLASLLEGYPALIRGFSMLLPFVLEDVVHAKL